MMPPELAQVLIRSVRAEFLDSGHLHCRRVNLNSFGGACSPGAASCLYEEFMPNFVRDVEEIRQRAARKIEEGPITEGYRGDVNNTIQILNEALATEIVCVLRYMHHYFMSTGVHGSSVAGEFKEHA